MNNGKMPAPLTGWVTAIVIVTVVTFAPVFTAGFTNYDDGTHLTNNPLVLSLHPDYLRAMFTTAVHQTYIPLTVLSFAVEYRLFGLNPLVYHLDNLLLHMGVGLLLFAFARRIGAPLAAAGIAALIFAVHPMHVESVAWVTERKDVLYAFFYLLALNQYTAYLQDGRRWRYVFSLVFALLSVLAKPMAVSLPLIFLLTGWFVTGTVSARRIFEIIPHTAAVAVIGLLTYLSHARFPSAAPAEGVLLWLWSLAFYFQKFLSPIGLSPMYTLPEPLRLQNPAYLSAAVIVAAAVLFWVVFRKNRWVHFAFLYFFLSIFFLLRFDTGKDVNVVADRFMYLPSAGFCLLLGVAAQQMLEKSRSSPVASGLARVWLGIVLLAFAVGAFQQCRIWNNSIALWTRAARYAPGELMIYVNRADALIAGHKAARAAADYRIAKRIYQERLSKKVPAPTEDVQGGQLLRRLSAAVTRHPDQAAVYVERGTFYARTGEAEAAMADFNRAIVLEPGNENAYINRGILSAQSGDASLALADVNRAIERKPDWPFAHFIRGNLWMEAGRWEEAIADYTQAIAQTPSEAPFFLNRGIALRRAGRSDEALRDFDKAVGLAPQMTGAYDQRAELYAEKGRLQEALADYSRALGVNDSLAEIYLKRADVYLRLGSPEMALKDAFKAQMLGARLPEGHLDNLMVQLSNTNQGKDRP